MKKGIRHIPLIVLLMSAISLVFAFGLSDKVMAATAIDSVYSATVDKAALQGVYRCYTYNNNKKTIVKREISPLVYNGIDSLLTGNDTDDKYVPLVSGIGSGSMNDVSRYNISSGALSCRQLLKGANIVGGLAGYSNGIVKVMGKTVPSKNADVKTIVDFVSGMGYYIPDVPENENGCKWYRLIYQDGNLKKDFKTNAVCKDNGKLKVDEPTSDAYFQLSEDGENEICLFLRETANTVKRHGKCTSLKDDTFNGEWLLQVVKNACLDDSKKSKLLCVTNAMGDGGKPEAHSYNFSSSLVDGEVKTSGGSLSSYKAYWSVDPLAPLKAIDYLTDGKYNSVGTATTGGPSILVGRLEKRLLYQSYLIGYYKVKVDCSENVSDLEFDGKLSWLDTESVTMKTCHYNKSTAENTDKSLNGVDGNGWFKYQTITGLENLITEIEGMPDNYSDEEIQAVAGVIDSGTESELVTTTDETDNCMSGGAGSLGWIVCPILEWLGSVSEGVYNEYVAPNLIIEPKLFQEGDTVLRDAWGNFRDIANVIFTILLLVVIFSQLTGVGIDNYGVKRILPKLILVAILINLSYVICVMLVDVSNIVGNSFQGLFNEMTGTIKMPDTISIDAGGGTDVISTGAITGLTGVGLLGALVAGGAAIYFNPAILLSLLVSALGIAVAIFFLFILLSAREAAVVVLIVTSPIALVLYALPNTRRTFDRWWKIFEGLLFVYPICGLLVGAGGYVSRLLIVIGAGGGFIGAFTSMMVSVMPIFFIPTLLKSSFAAMGNLGAMISGAGRKVGGTLTGTARNSQAFKNSQERGMERRIRIQAGVDEDGKAMELGRVGRFLRGGNRNIARSRSQYLRNQDMRGREKSLLGVGYDAAVIGQTKRAEADEMANYMTLINDKTRNGEDENTLFSIFDQYMAAGNKAGVVAAARIAGRRKDTAARFMDEKLTATRTVDNRSVPVTASYNQDMLQSIAKEMTTGENSKNYRASAPLGFEFASQINKSDRDENGSLRANINYGQWASQSENIKDALEHHVTNSSELVGMKGSSLKELAGMMEDGRLDANTKARIRKLANETIQNRGTTGVWDSTKEDVIYKLAGKPVSSNSGERVVRDKNGRVVGTQSDGGIWLR